MIHLVGISGSVRRGSFNSAVLRAMASMVPPQCELAVESIADVPLYNGDVEAEHGIPAPVARLKDLVAAADGLVLVTPEYNNGIPGVAKNAIDWMSRPPADAPRVFRGKPVALAGASPGNFGTILSQNAWLPVFRTLGAELWAGGRLMVPRANTVVDTHGEIADTPTRDRIRKFIDDFAAHLARL
jgi:NAD(P)H-dependent FMN reductase